MPAGAPPVEAARYPHLSAFLDRLGAFAPMQRRTFDSRAGELEPAFWDDAEFFFRRLNEVMAGTGMTLDQAVQSYVSICKDAVQEQFKFVRTGRYSAATMDEAHSRTADYEVMTRYMLGLAVTQYFWPQHYETFRFFRTFLQGLPAGGHHLEIGPGHGFYLLEAMRHAPARSFEAVDISQASVDIAKNVVSFLALPGQNVRFHVQNILTWTPSRPYDVIVMGEVLEHVEDPESLLRRAASFLAPNGQLFMTTCANCPAIDHIYLFTSADDIRALIARAGCHVVKEHAAERDVGMRHKDGSVIMTTQYAAALRLAN